MEIKLTFTEDDLAYMRTKFEINDMEDLLSAVWECISTYMEM